MDWVQVGVVDDDVNPGGEVCDREGVASGEDLGVSEVASLPTVEHVAEHAAVDAHDGARGVIEYLGDGPGRLAAGREAFGHDERGHGSVFRSRRPIGASLTVTVSSQMACMS